MVLAAHAFSLPLVCEKTLAISLIREMRKYRSKGKPNNKSKRPNNNNIVLSMGFPDSSVGKESTCNAGDPGSMPGSGRSSAEGIG